MHVSRYPLPDPDFLSLPEPDPDFFSLKISGFRVAAIYTIISPGFLAPCSMLHAQDGKTSTKDYEKLLDLPRPFSEIYK